MCFYKHRKCKSNHFQTAELYMTLGGKEAMMNILNYDDMWSRDQVFASVQSNTTIANIYKRS